MTYSPHTDADRAAMLAAVGVNSIDDLFADIPASVRPARFDLPPPLTEQEVRAEMTRLAGRNRIPEVSFLGAGAYRRLIPAVVDEVVARAEFATAYTPYQPEVSQGTLQSIYEFQSLVCELTGMEVASASHYDGATATAEGALMACRLTGRDRVAVSRAVHPQVRRVLETYCSGPGIEVVEVDADLDEGGSGQTDLAAVGRVVDGSVACLVVQQPNVFGVPGADGRPGGCRSRGRRPVRDPGRPDQPGRARGSRTIRGRHRHRRGTAARHSARLRRPLSRDHGGPHERCSPASRSAGRAPPATPTGRRGYVLTLQAREQHIRREKAASNICTNQALCALAATAYLSAVGPDGLREVAERSAGQARHLVAVLEQAGRATRRFGAPYFNEVAVRVPDAARRHAVLADQAASWPGWSLRASTRSSPTRSSWLPPS